MPTCWGGPSAHLQRKLSQAHNHGHWLRPWSWDTHRQPCPAPLLRTGGRRGMDCQQVLLRSNSKFNYLSNGHVKIIFFTNQISHVPVCCVTSFNQKGRTGQIKRQVLLREGEHRSDQEASASTARSSSGWKLKNRAAKVWHSLLQNVHTTSG